MKNIVVIGFGHIGSVISGVLANSGYFVVGIEKNINLIKNFKNNNSPISEPNLQNIINTALSKNNLLITNKLDYIKSADVIIITVGTPLDEQLNADLTSISDCCKEIEPFLKNEQLILIKSTIPPGTTKNLISKILNKNKSVDIAFSPERLAEGNAIEELKRLPIVVGGVTKKSGIRGCLFWEKAIGVKTLNVLNSETAEMVKLANNAWIDLNIALANDLARLSDKLPYNIDILEVVKAANTLKKGMHHVNILSPSVGVGGYCLTKDPWFLYSLGKKHKIKLNTIKAGRDSNEIMPSYSSKIITDFFKKNNIKNVDAKISILGFSFKNESGDTRYTPAINFIEDLKKHGFNNIIIYDPIVTTNDKLKFSYNFEDDIEKVISQSHCIAYLTAHEKIKNLEINKIAKFSKKGALVFDGRRYFTQDEINKILKTNLFYKGIGR